MCGFLISADKTIELKQAFKSIEHRGPDEQDILEVTGGFIAFHRLRIMDLTSKGSQPFRVDQDALVCNGEIYNHRELKREVDHEFKSDSDCEVLLPLILKYGIESAVKKLDAEFALCFWDNEAQTFKAARDAIGIRPLFYGHTKEEKIMFASEVKALQAFCEEIIPFPPGHFFDGKEFISYVDLTTPKAYLKDSLEDSFVGIRDRLEKAVIKRLDADAPLGFLLSGGLDSSLVCSIAARHSTKPIKTFSIGMETDAIDLKYAKEVADFIGSDHTEVIINKEDVLGCLRDVIWHLETFDITTIRASVGMYLICKYIHEKTDVKVLLTGEVSDEIFGYKYTDFAPGPEEFQKEAKKRVDELYIYDVLRADRCLSAHSIEARVPFSDQELVSYVMALNPEIKMNHYGAGKYLLRKAFEEGDYLTHSILWREKAAFSDAVGHSLVDFLKQAADEQYTKSDVSDAYKIFPHATPFTKESLMYRHIFEEYFKGHEKLIKGFWMPNKEWENCDVDDPSARVLPNYGASGS